MEKDINTIKRSESLPQSGAIHITKDEQAYLNATLDHPFQQHPTFPDVQIQPLDITHVPQEMQLMFTRLGKLIKAFTAIQTNKEVPEHIHTTDEEIYFFGKNALVQTKTKKGIIDTPLTEPELFVAALLGGSHSVKKIDKQKPAIFFAVKLFQ